MMKLGWSAVSIDSLWAWWFRTRYFRCSSIWHLGNPRGGSCIWKRIRSMAFYLQRGRSWKLRNGLSIKVWFDNWIDHDPIASRFPHLDFSKWDLVADIIQNNCLCIPTHLLAELQAFLLQSTSHIPIGGISVPDTLSWQGNHSRNLSLKEARHTLRTRQAVVNWSGLVWNKIINSRLACFCWHLLQRKTPTDHWAKHRGWSMASKCCYSLSNDETELHLFFQLWTWLLSHVGPTPYFPLSASASWTAIAQGVDVVGRKSVAAIFFHVISILWSLWNDSNHYNQKPSLARAKFIFLDHM